MVSVVEDLVLELVTEIRRNHHRQHKSVDEVPSNEHLICELELTRYIANDFLDAKDHWYEENQKNREGDKHQVGKEDMNPLCHKEQWIVRLATPKQKKRTDLLTKAFQRNESRDKRIRETRDRKVAHRQG